MKTALAMTAISFVTFILTGCTLTGSKQHSDAYFTSWPEGTSPLEIGTRVTERFIASPHPNFGWSTPPEDIRYPETCAWYGALTFAELAGDRELTRQLIARFEPLFGEEANLVPCPGHVDATVFGSVPLELYIQTRQSKYLEMGQYIADKQWEDPRPDGLTRQARFWIDDMYMITMVQVQAYRATGDAKYIDRAAHAMTVYLDRLQMLNGLFYHAADIPFYWGRGNGWMAAGLTELLRSLPQDHPRYQPVMAGYQKMMASLLMLQDDNGMWLQLLDHPGSWPETSCTGMFTFAMITGVKNCWLDEAVYGPAARKGWLALIEYIDENADIHEVCEGTNKKNSMEHYMNRKRVIGDMHGQAPVLWCASALLR